MFTEYKTTIILLIKCYVLLFICRAIPSALPSCAEWVILCCALFAGALAYLDCHIYGHKSKYTKVQLHFRE